MRNGFKNNDLTNFGGEQMLVKKRTESRELLIFRSLNARMVLSEKEKRQYINMENGFTGEVLFDKQSEILEDKFYVLNDLFLEVNHSSFQIDKLLISSGLIYLFEVKYFQGDWYLKDDKLYCISNQKEYKNPVDQLKRCVMLFKELLMSLKQNYLVEAHVVFVNPEFTLYQAPMNLPILLPTQINRFLNELNRPSLKFNESDANLAQKLLMLNRNENPFIKLPHYSYEQIKKGIMCEKCQSFSLSVEGRICICRDCGYTEPASSAVLRTVKEFQLLFPDKKINTTIIHDWCKVLKSKRAISPILKKNFKMTGTHQWAYYE